MAPQENVQRCIPLGCICINLLDSEPPSALSSLPELNDWTRFTVVEGPGKEYPPDHCLAHFPPLTRELQNHLLSSWPKLWIRLLNKRWIEAAFRLSIDVPAAGVLRIYLLPDDVHRRDIDRSDERLRKARLDLLSNIDFSHQAWVGNFKSSARSAHPIPCRGDDCATNEDQSLLHMFNNIPSPDPHPELIQDHYAQDAAHELLGNEVVGLRTSLYEYQRRSAAVMLQRESQPVRILDPRLIKVLDQDGKPWYFDRVNGFGLREPRLYDGVNGGILAEEMGAGKTLICLALILATKYQSSQVPEIYRGQPISRPKIASLADMAAATINQHALPWKPYLGESAFYELDHQNCRRYLRRNPGFYHMPSPGRMRHSRKLVTVNLMRKIFLSHATIVIVPANLVEQWRQEIAKHTLPGSLRTVVIANSKQAFPPVEELIETDIILFSIPAFEKLGLTDGVDHPLTSLYFKRCIVDEGHRFGTSTPSSKSNLLLALDVLQLSARWIVTGTPAKGLYGLERSPDEPSNRHIDFSDSQEREDLKKLGAITTLYLRARPWANTALDYGDRPAEWSVYVLQPKHSKRSNGRTDCLRATLDSLIIRHDMSQVSGHLAKVKEKTTFLDGTYQDHLALNTFSMVLAINAVTSQRVDRDYMFDPRNRKALLATVNNLKQASFFAGPFWTLQEISGAVDTATHFLEERNVPLSAEDEALLKDAITAGLAAMSNPMLHASKRFREVPLYVKDFPGGLGEAWSLDEQAVDPVQTNAHMIEKLQKYLSSAVDAPNSLRLLFESGKFEEVGRETRRVAAIDVAAGSSRKGRTQRKENTVGDGSSGSASSVPISQWKPIAGREATRNATTASDPLPSALREPVRFNKLDQHTNGSVIEVAEALRKTRIISTASAKMTYLIDQITRHQEAEKILVFYEHGDVAWHVAYMLEILDIEHRIYTPTLTSEQRAAYVANFNNNPKHRVMLMDIKLAAYGLDLQAASRIYFVNPVLDPQVEAQAIGRARRIGQTKPVTVESLVLKGSLEEVIFRRKQEMTGAEQRQVHTILDDKPIYEWIKNPRFLPIPKGEVDDLAQTKMFQDALFVFPQRRGQNVEGNEELRALRSLSTNPNELECSTHVENPHREGSKNQERTGRLISMEASGALLLMAPKSHEASASKRKALDIADGPVRSAPTIPSTSRSAGTGTDMPSRPAQRVRFS